MFKMANGATRRNLAFPVGFPARVGFPAHWLLGLVVLCALILLCSHSVLPGFHSQPLCAGGEELVLFAALILATETAWFRRSGAWLPAAGMVPLSPRHPPPKKFLKTVSSQ